MDPNSLAIGAAALTAGVLGIATGMAARAFAARGRVHREALNQRDWIADKLDEHLGYKTKHGDLVDALARTRSRAAAAEHENAVLHETLERLGAENEALRIQIEERAEETELLEVELTATKAALETEENQATLWANLARGLGFTPDHAGAAMSHAA